MVQGSGKAPIVVCQVGVIVIVIIVIIIIIFVAVVAAYLNLFLFLHPAGQQVDLRYRLFRLLTSPNITTLWSCWTCNTSCSECGPM